MQFLHNTANNGAKSCSQIPLRFSSKISLGGLIPSVGSRRTARRLCDLSAFICVHPWVKIFLVNCRDCVQVPMGSQRTRVPANSRSPPIKRITSSTLQPAIEVDVVTCGVHRTTSAYSLLKTKLAAGRRMYQSETPPRIVPTGTNRIQSPQAMAAGIRDVSFSRLSWIPV